MIPWNGTSGDLSLLCHTTGQKSLQLLVHILGETGFINSFWNLLTFRTSFRELVSDDQVKEDALMCRKLIPALDFLKSEENRPQFLLPRRFSGSQISCKSVTWLWNFQMRYKKMYRAEKSWFNHDNAINLFWIEVYTFEIKVEPSFIFFQSFRWFMLQFT